jgi:MFS family permease
MLAASVPLFAVFAAQQVRRKRAGGAPLVEPSVFANRSYVSGVAFALVFLAVMGGATLTIGILMQLGLGYTPIEAAIASAPFALAGFVGAGIGGGTMEKLGRHVLHAGLVLFAVGFVGLYVVMQDAGTAIGGWDFTFPLAIAGLGMGMVWVPLFDIILGGVADHEVGSASGVLQSVQQLGMTLGVAVLGTVFFGTLTGGQDRVADFLGAAEVTALLTVGLLVVAIVVGFALPRHARSPGAPVGTPEPAMA